MKKKILFLALLGSLVGFTAISQQDETVYHNKKKKIFEGADHYMHEKDWLGNVRYDIVAISLAQNHPEIYRK